ERGAEHGGMRDLAADTAPDAAVVHMSDRVGTQGIGIRLDGQGGTTGEANAGVIAGTGVGVDPEPLADDTPALIDRLLHQRADPPLAVELALPLRNDDLGSAELRRQRLAQNLQSLRHIVRARMPHPFHPNAPDSVNDRVVPLPVLVRPA